LKFLEVGRYIAGGKLNMAKILIVDDDDSIREVLRKTLSRDDAKLVLRNVCGAAR